MLGLRLNRCSGTSWLVNADMDADAAVDGAVDAADVRRMLFVVSVGEILTDQRRG